MKAISFLILAALISGCGEQQERLPCPSDTSCLEDPNCKCWCSQICKFRDKKPEDRPIYIQDDPNEKYCYCKQWDYDHYEDNCIEGKKIKEPPNAQ